MVRRLSTNKGRIPSNAVMTAYVMICRDLSGLSMAFESDEIDNAGIKSYEIESYEIESYEIKSSGIKFRYEERRIASKKMSSLGLLVKNSNASPIFILLPELTPQFV